MALGGIRKAGLYDMGQEAAKGLESKGKVANAAVESFQARTNDNE